MNKQIILPVLILMMSGIPGATATGSSTGVDNTFMYDIAEPIPVNTLKGGVYSTAAPYRLSGIVIKR